MHESSSKNNTGTAVLSSDMGDRIRIKDCTWSLYLCHCDWLYHDVNSEI